MVQSKAFAAGALALVLAGSFAAAAPARFGAVDDVRLLHAETEPQNWLTTGGGRSEQHYSRLDQINLDTVSRLKPAWSFVFDTTRKQESEPLVVDGVMFVTTSWSKVYALDAKTGKPLWFYDPKVPGRWGIKACCDVVNRGAAVYHGKVYVGTIDGRLIALDAASGKPVWSVDTKADVHSERRQEYSITGAPAVFKNKVLIGNGGADFGARGYVTAYDSETGRKVWRFYTVPGNPANGPDHEASDSAMKLAAPTWSGDWYKYGGGGTAWNTLVYDPELNQVYVGTGNGSPWNSLVRTAGKGDNFFLASIIALDPDTGAYRWHYQVNPRESWDYSATMPVMLADMKIGGQNRKVLMQAPKNGFFYVLDRTTGKLISAEKTMAEINWASSIDVKTGRPVEADGIRYYDKPFRMIPASNGIHNWPPMAFSPKTGLVYLDTAASSTEYFTALRQVNMIIDGPYNNGSPHDPIKNGRAALIAWNPVTQKLAWQQGWAGNGVLATAGDLVFQSRGNLTGELTAVRADTGKPLWRGKTPNNLVQAPMSYAVDGKQYIAVVGGSGSNPNAPPLAAQPGRLFVFTLDGMGKFPDGPPAAPPFSVTREAFSDAQTAHGSQLYGQFCSRCHGGGITGGGGNNIPDLHRSSYLTDKAAWRTVVIDGALQDMGMISWKHLLKPQDAEDIRAFVATAARTLADAQKAGAARKPAGRSAGDAGGR